MLRRLLLFISLFGTAFSFGDLSPLAVAGTSLLTPKAEKVEADPKKDYFLTESAGNWFVMVKKFSGDNAAYQAKRLVYELRASYKMKAYVFKYDPDQMEMDALSQKVGKTKKFHYQTARAVEYAVLVGGFPTGADPVLQKTLETIRKSSPKSLQNDPLSKQAAEQFKQRAKQDSKYAGYGALGGATPVPNPLLPMEYFNHKGIVDPFIAKLNSDCKYSLLNNKKMYTVRIATFSGDTSMKKSSDKFDDLNQRLQYAGMRAAALCEALRNSGVEAWEFHDRDCSFVTIGSFDQYGKVQPDGRTELNPQVAQIMKKYGGELVNDESGNSKYRAYTIVVDVPDPSSSSLKPKKRQMTLACDLRPVIIVVPQRSGEENVRKIAMAQNEMNKAKELRDAESAVLSLEKAEQELESMNQVAKINDRVFETEEEFNRWEAEQNAKRAVAETSTVNRAYAEQLQPANASPRGVEARVSSSAPATTNAPSLASPTKPGAASPAPVKTARKNSAPTF